MGKVIIIRVDGTIEETEQDTAPSLEDVQGIVGGWIKGVPYFNKYEGEKCQAWCDEEGKLKGYEYNEKAMQLWVKCLRRVPDDALVGDICILTGSCMLD